jgi:hypothetical protein
MALTRQSALPRYPLPFGVSADQHASCELLLLGGTEQTDGRSGLRIIVGENR